MLLLAQVQLDKPLQSKLDPSDLVQETNLAVCRDFPQFRGKSEQEFAAWLRRVMANVCLKMIRTYKGTQRAQRLLASRNSLTTWIVPRSRWPD